MAQSKVTTGNIFKKILGEGSNRDPYIKQGEGWKKNYGRYKELPDGNQDHLPSYDISKQERKLDDDTLSEIENEGEYLEAPGGGTPLKKGQKAPSKAWVYQHREMQPRDPDGKFGYKANNGRALKYFVNGKSRGHTVPHYIRHLQLDLIFNKNREGSTIAYEGKIQYIKSIDMTKEEFIEAAKVAKEHYASYGTFDKTKENRGVKEFVRDALNKPHATLETKQGRHSAKEREMLANEDPEKAVEVDSAKTVKERREKEAQKKEITRIRNYVPTPQDRDLAKNDPQKFYRDNKEYVNRMKETLSKGRGKPVGKAFVVSAVANGRINDSIKEIEKSIRGR